MKIPEMAWITAKLNIVVVECLLYLFIIQNLYIFCLLSYSNSNRSISLELHEFYYFCDWICGFSVRGRPLASSMNEKDIITCFTDKAWA